MFKKKKSPKLSIVTIVLNNKLFFEYTLKSVLSQSFKNFEYIVIDGGSTDGTLDVVTQYRSKIDYFVSEKDSGIYNAINKGIRAAKGEWLLILNAGDRFVDESVLNNAFQQNIPKDKYVLFGDWFTCNLMKNPAKLIPDKADLKAGKFLHQALFYKRDLHLIFGQYIETKKLIVSDYIFFANLPESYFVYLGFPVAINDNTGISTQYWSYKQKMAYDFILGKISLFGFLFEVIRIYIPRIDLYILLRIKRIYSVFARKR